MTGIGLIEALRRSGLSKRAAWDLETRGALGTVLRVNGHRRYTSEQVSLLERIGVLREQLCLRLDEATAVALSERSPETAVSDDRLRELASRSVHEVERALKAWVVLTGVLIGRAGE